MSKTCVTRDEVKKMPDRGIKNCLQLQAKMFRLYDMANQCEVTVRLNTKVQTEQAV